FAAGQAWPILRILAAIAPSTAASRSASSNTRNGALPPSSIEVRMMVLLHCSSNSRPTAVDPVKESLRDRESAISGLIVSLDRLVRTTFTTPSGRPARVRMSAKARVHSGVSPAGLITEVHPAAMAGPILRVPIASGKFHGVISRLTPTGSLLTRNREPPFGAVM